MEKEYILDKQWRFLLGDTPASELVSHFDSYTNSKAGNLLGIPSVSYNDEGWRLVDLPHDYFTETEFLPENLLSHGYKTRCNAWYRKTFLLPEPCRGKHILLSFEGMAVNATVYVNGSLTGRSFSAYAPLDMDITDRARFGDEPNVIAVQIDGLSTEGWWYEGAGIYRHVRLYVKELLHIAHQSAFVKPVYMGDGLWNADFSVTAENTGYEDGSCRLKAELFDGDTCIAAAYSDAETCIGDGACSLHCRAQVTNPRLWDVDDPELYRAVFTLLQGESVLDSYETSCGFRTFRVDKDKGFFLNGKPIKLKGTCNHQDHAGVGVAVPDALQYYRIRRLKEMGTNAYRCSHNMPTPAVLDACDTLGLLVMDENRRFENRPEVLNHMEAMVRRDRNHPCVVMYSLFNEEPLQGTAEGARIYRRMRSRLLRLDDSRLLTGAMSGGMCEDESAACYMDVTGINYKIPEGVLQYRRKYPQMPVLGTENNSAVSSRGCYETDREKHLLSCYDEETVSWGQTIRATWKFVREHDWFGGIFIWTGFDYRGEPTPFRWPSSGSFFGIMDSCGFAKDSFYQNRSCFVTEPMVHILPPWNFREGETVRVMTASNCQEVEMFLNGASLGRQKSDCCEPCVWQVPFAPGVLSAVGYLDGKAVATAKNLTAGQPRRIVLEPDRSTMTADGMDAMPVNVKVVDRDGITVENASDLISFTLSGDGVLLGVGNGDPNSHESDHAPRRHLYSGRAQVILGAAEGGKMLKLTAAAPGLEPCTVEIPLTQPVRKPEFLYSTVCRGVSGITVSTGPCGDAAAVIAENDMNSMEPITFARVLKPGFTEGKRLFRAFFQVPQRPKNAAQGLCTLQFRDVRGKRLQVYVDGTLIADATDLNGAYYASYKPHFGEKSELRLVLEADGSKPAGFRHGINVGVK